MKLVKCFLVLVSILSSSQTLSIEALAKPADYDDFVNTNRPGSRNENGNLHHTGASDRDLKAHRDEMVRREQWTEEDNQNFDRKLANDANRGVFDENELAPMPPMYRPRPIRNDRLLSGAQSRAMSVDTPVTRSAAERPERYAIQEEQAREGNSGVPWFLSLFVLASAGVGIYLVRNRKGA